MYSLLSYCMVKASNNKEFCTGTLGLYSTGYLICNGIFAHSKNYNCSYKLEIVERHYSPSNKKLWPRTWLSPTGLYCIQVSEPAGRFSVGFGMEGRQATDRAGFEGRDDLGHIPSQGGHVMMGARQQADMGWTLGRRMTPI